LCAMVLANDAEHGTGAGDPLELALLDYAASHGLNVAEITRQYPRKSVVPFDSTYKFMRVTVEERGQLFSYFTGATEVLLQRSRLSDSERQNWEEKAQG